MGAHKKDRKHQPGQTQLPMFGQAQVFLALPSFGWKFMLLGRHTQPTLSSLSVFTDNRKTSDSLKMQ